MHCLVVGGGQMLWGWLEDPVGTARSRIARSSGDLAYGVVTGSSSERTQRICLHRGEARARYERGCVRHE